MYSTRNAGSLAVVENTVDRRRIERELRGLDPQLFLDAEIDLRHRFVWTVKYHVGSEHPPHLVFEWRDQKTNEPLPLTMGIVDRVKRLEGAGHTVFREVSEHNRRLVAEREARSDQAYTDITNDMEPRMRDTRSAVLHRGVGLRMSRDKRRARGEKV